MMRRTLLSLALLAALVPEPALPAAAASGLRVSLEVRAAADPTDAAARRMLGRLLLKAGDASGAVEHLAAAVEFDPLSAAARCDLGRALAAKGDPAGAAEQFQAVIDLAPESEYAADAATLLAELPGGGIRTVDYEIREFPGPPPPELSLDPTDRDEATRWPIAARLETGVLYDSNVALAPLSRQLAPGDRASVRLFAAPEVEWAAVRGEGWAAGPLFAGNFTLNEGDFREFDLQSYTPGAFAEAAIPFGAATLIPRLEYRFTLDEFAGSTFGRRHGVLGRLTALEKTGEATVGYLAADHTDYADDGVLPEVTSADGLLYSGGIARELAFDLRHLSRLRLGIDLDRLDARGSDYAYWGAGLTGEVGVPIVPTVELTLRGGAGYRGYDRYEFEPGRDEFVYRAGGELRKYFTPWFSAAAVASYQRFDSDSPLFDADRFLAGVVTEFTY